MDLVDGTGLIIEQPSETESELGLLPCVKTLPLRLSTTSGSISLPSALLLIRGSNDLRTNLCEDVGNMSIRPMVSKFLGTAAPGAKTASFMMFPELEEEEE